MSNMLADAIVDAKSLRDAALKSAENLVIEKYSHEVRKTLETLIEQDEMEEIPGDTVLDAPAEEPPPIDMGAPAPDGGDAPMEEQEEVVEGGDVPLAATANLSTMDGENLSGFASEGENVDISIDLGALQEAVEELQSTVDEEIELTEEDLAAILEGDEELDELAQAKAAKRPRKPHKRTPVPEEEEIEEQASSGPIGDSAYSDAEDEDDTALKTSAATNQDAKMMPENLDELVDSIVEKLTVDTVAELSGWGGRPTSQLKDEQERALAGAQTDETKEELKDLNKAQEELFAENKRLAEQNDQYKQAVEELREGLQDVNLSNARLLYTNRVLRNTSLNERQKTKIVEAISNAGSVTEARTIFDTLQSTVEATPKRSPQSLSEAIERNRTSVIRATRQESTASDPWSDRMKKLAGIK